MNNTFYFHESDCVHRDDVGSHLRPTQAPTEVELSKSFIQEAVDPWIQAVVKQT